MKEEVSKGLGRTKSAKASVGIGERSKTSAKTSKIDNRMIHERGEGAIAKFRANCDGFGDFSLRERFQVRVGSKKSLSNILNKHLISADFGKVK